MKDNQDHLNLLRKINVNPNFSQRKLAKELGFSLGKLNYSLKALKKKGLIKIKNFKKQQNKIQYIQYVITPKGIAERTKLTINFMKRKMKEYDELKREVDISGSQNFQDKNYTQ
jgi:EPS-associated MarR family transcriptional regulator